MRALGANRGVFYRKRPARVLVRPQNRTPHGFFFSAICFLSSLVVATSEGTFSVYNCLGSLFLTHPPSPDGSLTRRQFGLG